MALLFGIGLLLVVMEIRNSQKELRSHSPVLIPTNGSPTSAPTRGFRGDIHDPNREGNHQTPAVFIPSRNSIIGDANEKSAELEKKFQSSTVQQELNSEADDFVKETAKLEANLQTSKAPHQLVTMTSIFPAEVVLDSVGFLNGKKALKQGKFNSRQRSKPAWLHSRSDQPNYGNLDVSLNSGKRRAIQFGADGLESKSAALEESESLGREDYRENALAYYDQFDKTDDDYVRSEVFAYRIANEECRLPSWHYLHFPTCNTFHETTIVHADSNSRYLGRGFFRFSFSIEETGQPQHILKTMRWRNDRENLFDRERFEKTRMDALIMERLTSSPRITDLFGHCATSIIVEPLPGEVWEVVVPKDRQVNREDLNDKEDVDPMNHFSSTEKIEMALQFAEGLSELHGFKDGMIVHDDLDLGQYLRTPDGELKLNDFNRAHALPYDTARGEYCKYYNGHIGGKFRAPEEFIPAILDESIDIFSLGNCFYGLLTGLWPHYLDDNYTAQEMLKRGSMPYIDKRYRTHSFAEGELVKAIEMCHKREPGERADVFTIVKHLKNAVMENREMNKKD